ncbi:MAG: RNA pseudouridine synthase [Firmicutes bacterium]|jgi:23S rRNA pseudouridine1911/1915/1917 synthase|nr:RNA pseudouridine synthase [Bacillota bacterium]
MKNRIAFEDKNILIVEKEAGELVQSGENSDIDLYTKVLDYIKLSNPKKILRAKLINRLDRPVGGLVIFTKTEEATKKLSAMVQRRQIIKEYKAWVVGKPDEDKGQITNHLKKLKSKNMSVVTDDNDKNSKVAILDYEVLESKNHEIYGEISLLNIRLRTGRHHQIRVQLSHMGHPIIGDRKYNNKEKNSPNFIWLWSYHLKFSHPKKKGWLMFIVNLLLNKQS